MRSAIYLGKGEAESSNLSSSTISPRFLELSNPEHVQNCAPFGTAMRHRFGTVPFPTRSQNQLAPYVPICHNVLEAQEAQLDTEARDKRVPIMLTASEVALIDDWRFENRVATRSDAIRRLCRIGLEADTVKSKGGQE